MRIAIMGNSGSGKSTLARQFVARDGLAALDLDTVAWEPGKVAIARSRADAVADVKAFCDAQNRWVVEGCYAPLVEATLAYGPTLLFLDPGVEACLSNCRNRPWEPHKYKSKQEQDTYLDFLLTWVRDYYTRDDDPSLAAHQALFDTYSGPKQRLVMGPGPGFRPQPAAYEE